MFADLRHHTQKNNGIQPVILLLSHPRVRPAHIALATTRKKMATTHAHSRRHPFAFARTHSGKYLGVVRQQSVLYDYIPLPPVEPEEPAAQGMIF